MACRFLHFAGQVTHWRDLRRPDHNIQGTLDIVEVNVGLQEGVESFQEFVDLQLLWHPRVLFTVFEFMDIERKTLEQADQERGGSVQLLFCFPLVEDNRFVNQHHAHETHHRPNIIHEDDHDGLDIEWCDEIWGNSALFVAVEENIVEEKHQRWKAYQQ